MEQRAYACSASLTSVSSPTHDPELHVVFATGIGVHAGYTTCGTVGDVTSTVTGPSHSRWRSSHPPAPAGADRMSGAI